MNQRSRIIHPCAYEPDNPESQRPTAEESTLRKLTQRHGENEHPDGCQHEVEEGVADGA